MPVEGMLAHSPPLPLIIDHIHPDGDVSAENEEGILLALQHRDRVRRIRLRIPASNSQKLIIAMDGEFPMLEYLHIRDVTSEETNLILPRTLYAPKLQLLILESIIYPTGSQLLTTTAGLVTLMLGSIPLPTDLSPGDVLLWLSLLPRLEIFGVSFHFPTFDSVAEGRLLHMKTMAHVTPPKLRRFIFEGTIMFLEALLPWITTPLLNGFQICLFEPPTTSIRCLQQFMTTKEQLKYNCARLIFEANLVSIGMYPPGWDETEPVLVEVNCARFGPWVEFIAQILVALWTAFFKVENLTLEYRSGMSILATPLEEFSRQRWREISNVKTLSFPSELAWVVSRSLHPEGRESPMDLLPELKELSYSQDRNSMSLCDLLASENLTAFAYARQNAGHPFTLVCRE
jgi:hypothetical protein